MSIDIVIPISTTCGKQLQGATSGRKHYARAWELLSDARPGSLVILDFSGVDVATGSWINAMIVPLFRRAVDPEIELFPVFCNVSADCRDDLALLAKWTHQCYLIADARRRPPRKATIVGELDQGQRETLSAVLESGAATGAALERSFPKIKIGATAWNNRLKDLHQKRLLRREKRGREQVYSPVVEVMDVDG